MLLQKNFRTCTSMRHHLMPVKKKTVFQKTKVTSVGKDVEKGREPL